MSYYADTPQKYNSAKLEVIKALGEMTEAMRQMGTQHVRFHEHFSDAEKRILSMKKAYRGKELDAEVIRSKALEPYVSESNLTKVTAVGHYEVGQALISFHLQKKKLEEIHNKTAELVDSLCQVKNEGGHGAGA